MAIVTVGIDLAKNVFALQGVYESGGRRLPGGTALHRQFSCGKCLHIIYEAGPCSAWTAA